MGGTVCTKCMESNAPLYSGHPWDSELAAIQRWPDYTYFQQGSPLWNIIRWLFCDLLYRFAIALEVSLYQ